MTSNLHSVLERASTLSEAEQDVLAAEVEERIIALKVARGEADIAAGNTTSIESTFTALRQEYERAG